jgi:hypothetical protein
VCTVCRRLPLREQSINGEDKLDAAFLSGIREELGSIEENEKNIQALSQVFRYYAKYAKQLSQVLRDFAVKNCFPWEIIHAMHLVDDILLMDNTGRYKAELADRVQGIAVKAFLEVQTEQERKEVIRMLQTWRELRIFEKDVFEAIKEKIRSSGREKILKLLDEVDLSVEEDAELLEVEAPVQEDRNGTSTSGDANSTAPLPAGVKRKREDDTNGTGTGVDLAAAAVTARRLREEAAAAKAPAAPTKTSVAAEVIRAKALATVERILAAPLDRPFQVLGISADGADGQKIRQAYRRIALIIHPDKNIGIEKQCQEALIKLQSSREQAEVENQRADSVTVTFAKGETRSAATAAKNENNDGVLVCKYHDCDLPPCKQCANGCCARNITHCHVLARMKGGLQCFFHPPPRAWARNA